MVESAAVAERLVLLQPFVLLVKVLLDLFDFFVRPHCCVRDLRFLALALLSTVLAYLLLDVLSGELLPLEVGDLLALALRSVLGLPVDLAASYVALVVVHS